MTSMLLNVIIQTIPKVNANNYEDGQIIVKSRRRWRNDFITGFSIVAACIIAVIFTDKLPVPYVGSLFFIGGIFGMLYSFLYAFRALMVYKYYDDIYSEEDLKKLEDKDS